MKPVDLEEALELLQRCLIHCVNCKAESLSEDLKALLDRLVVKS